MEKLGIKATFYDLFGYVIPGTLSIVLAARVWEVFSSGLDYTDIWEVTTKMNAYALLGVLGVSYITGHFVSALSSRVVEKGICEWIEKLASQTKLATVLPSLHGKLKDRYNEQFEVALDERSLSLITTVVEEKMPRTYSTAFIFLSIYGMARSLSLVFFCAVVVEFVLALADKSYCFIAIFLLVPTVVFFLHYIKFRRHFIAQVCNAYLAYRSEYTAGMSMHNEGDK